MDLNFSYYLLAGSLLPCLYYFLPKYKPVILIIIITYWLLIALNSLNITNTFNFFPIIWLKEEGVYFSYNFDNLSKIFSLLISFIGVLIFYYSYYYFEKDAIKQNKLISLLHLFAISMLGVVTADNSIVFFLFWELTSVISYLLIQFDNSKKDNNQAAFNALFISVLGGLSILIGFILLNINAGNWDISAFSKIEVFKYSFIILPLFLVGALTKSAQFPFYFWLCGAMRAPTPVSSYLHSATMVTAGIYLLARFHHIFSDNYFWYLYISIFSQITMVITSVLSLFQKDLKLILAYTTIFILSNLIYLMGSHNISALKAAMGLLIFHGLYKSAAFMLTGALDKIYKNRDIYVLSGVIKNNIFFIILSVVIFGSMAGLPPFYSFTVKEMLYEAKIEAGQLYSLSFFLNIFSSAFVSAASLRCLWFLICATPYQKYNKIKVNKLLYPVVLLSLIIVVLSIFPYYLDVIASSAATSIIPNYFHANNINQKFEVNNFSISLVILFLGAFIAGIKIFLEKDYKNNKYFSMEMMFNRFLSLVVYISKIITFYTQHLKLNKKLLITLIYLSLIILLSIILNGVDIVKFFPDKYNFHINTDLVILIISIFISIFLLIQNNFLTDLIYISLLGSIIALFFITKGAPDLAMTQILVEILSMVFIGVSLRKRIISSIKEKNKLLRFLFAVIFSSLILLLINYSLYQQLNYNLPNYFINNSLAKGYGKNIVNVILVDFRAFDTFGEVLVIFSSAVAIFLIIKKDKK